MPLYEYKCPECGYTFEVIQSFNAVAPDEGHLTPKGEVCQGKVERLLSRSSFQLKGGGWAKDGY